MPFKGCLSDACVLMKIERFVLKPLRKIERFVLKQHTFRFADYTFGVHFTMCWQFFLFSRYRMSAVSCFPKGEWFYAPPSGKPFFFFTAPSSMTTGYP